MRVNHLCRAAAAGLACAAALSLPAQTSIPPDQGTHFKDTSSLKPPPGARVAVIEYEDLECPGCADAYPVVHAAVNRYHVPLLEYDFQIPDHVWSHDAAIFAHYLAAKLSPQLADEYRREIFAAQSRISSLDDLHRFTQHFMAQHGKPMPPAVDPTGQFAREVDASTTQGVRMGLIETPTIFVVTPNHWIQVVDPDQTGKAIAQAEAEVARTRPAPPHSLPRSH